MIHDRADGSGRAAPARADSRANSRAASVGGALVLACVLGAPARAQVLGGPLLGVELPLPYDRGRNTGVLDRERPEYQALGIRAGAFTVLPRVEAAAGYSSNVYGATDDEEADAFLAVDPTVTAESGWSVHSLSLSTGARLRRFADETPRDETGLFARADGRFDISRAAYVAAGAFAERAYEQRYSGSFPQNARGNVRYVNAGGYLRATYQAGRVGGTLAIDANALDFRDVRALDGGAIEQDDRDRRVVRVAGTAEYAVTPGASVFVQLGAADIGYDRRLPDGSANRDGRELRALTGVSFDLTALIRGRVGVGYVRRSFSSPAYDPIAGIAAEGRLEWFPTGLTTVTLGARRQVAESDFVGSSGYFSTALTARVDHELLRNLLLNATAAYERDDFRGIDRRDNILSASAGARYLLSRRIGLGVDAFYVDRRSSGTFPGQEFDEARATASVILQI